MSSSRILFKTRTDCGRLASFNAHARAAQRPFADVARVLFRADGESGQMPRFRPRPRSARAGCGRTGRLRLERRGRRRITKVPPRPSCFTSRPVPPACHPTPRRGLISPFTAFGSNPIHGISRIKQAATGLGGKLLERDDASPAGTSNFSWFVSAARTGRPPEPREKSRAATRRKYRGAGGSTPEVDESG